VRGGRDRVDHPRGFHDDVANAAAGALVHAHRDAGYSGTQRAKDNEMLALAYKRLARSIV